MNLFYLLVFLMFFTFNEFFGFLLVMNLKKAISEDLLMMMVFWVILVNLLVILIILVI